MQTDLHAACQAKLLDQGKVRRPENPKILCGHYTMCRTVIIDNELRDVRRKFVPRMHNTGVLFLKYLYNIMPLTIRLQVTIEQVKAWLKRNRLKEAAGRNTTSLIKFVKMTR
jgi:hypothetical protein